MKYALANSLSTSVSGLDPDAKAYIQAIESTSTSVSSIQKNAINTFVKNGKADGWYPLLKRFYLPIWAASAPNAIDLIQLGSGTFVGGVSHSSGYIQGNATTGYFNIGATPSTIGLLPSSCWHGRIYLTAASANYQEGCFQEPLRSCTISRLAGSTQRTSDCMTDASSTGRDVFSVAGDSAMTGILSLSRLSGTTRLRVRKSSGRTTYTDITRSDVGSPPITRNYYVLALNFNNGPVQGHNMQVGAHWLGTGATDAQDSLFTQSLKTLWETCTGSTLP